MFSLWLSVSMTFVKTNTLRSSLNNGHALNLLRGTYEQTHRLYHYISLMQYRDCQKLGEMGKFFAETWRQTYGFYPIIFVVSTVSLQGKIAISFSLLWPLFFLMSVCFTNSPFLPSPQNDFQKEGQELQDIGPSSCIAKQVLSDSREVSETLAPVDKGDQALDAENEANQQGVIEVYTSTGVPELTYMHLEHCKTAMVLYKVCTRNWCQDLSYLYQNFSGSERMAPLKHDFRCTTSVVFRNSAYLALKCKLSLWCK